MRRRIGVVSLLVAAVALGQDGDAALRALIAATPKLPLATRVIPYSGKIGYPSSVAMGADGTLYVLQRDDTAPPVIAQDKQGKVLRSWGTGMFKIPHAIRIDPKGNIWTVDAGNSMIYKFTPEGRKLQEISVGEQPEGKTGFTGTTDIAFAPNGHMYISDGYGNARVLEYLPDGTRVRAWGSAGNGPGQFKQPHGIAVDKDGIVYVADRQNGRLQRFDGTGKYLGEWTHLGMVTTVAIRDGELWIGTQLRGEPTSANGWLVKLDRKTGKPLGYVESAHGHHVVNVSKGGELQSGARPDQILFFGR